MRTIDKANLFRTAWAAARAALATLGGKIRDHFASTLRAAYAALRQPAVAVMTLRHDTGRRNRQSRTAWVARITGRDPQYGLARAFLDGEFYHDQGEDVAKWGP